MKKSVPSRYVVAAGMILLLAAAPAPAGELVTRYDLESGIGETVLPNGLTVLTLERHSAPVVSCQLWYRVGSADERTGETGLAHFLEHMMFKGTDRYGKGEIDRITLKLGGSNNAATSKDFTYFHFDLAADRWEVALEIEANRLRRLALAPDEFLAERRVVLEELEMGRDAPWGELDESIEAVVWLSHPYRHPIIGWRGELAAVDRERMKAFYDRHYHPRNATLVVVGDFDTGRALARIQELFGALPAGPERTAERTPEPPQNGERRITVRRDIEASRLEVLHRSLPVSDPDEVALDVIGRVLTGGKAARLTRRLLEEERLVTSVDVWNDSRRDDGLFWVYAELAPDADPARVEKILLEETDRLRTEPVGEDELLRAKRGLLSRLVFRRATAQGRAEEIGYQATVADWRLAVSAAERIEGVTPEMVRRVAARVFLPRQRTVGLALPAESGDGSGGGAKHGSVRRASAARGGAAAGGTSVRLDPAVIRLENGLTLMVARNRTVPVLALNVHVDAGHLREPVPGLAWLTGKYLLEGAGGRDGIELAVEIERIGASVDTGSSGLAARCLSRDAERLVATVADVLRRPDLPAESLGKLAERTISEIRAEKDDPQMVALRTFRRLVYGAHPSGRAARGTEESVGAIRREEILAYHRTRYVPGNTVIAAVSDLPTEELVEILRGAFEDWSGEAPVHPVLPPVVPTKRHRETVARGTGQSNIYLGHLGIRRSHPDYYSLLVMDYVLGMGPGFTDRLSRTLRDRDGLAYSVYASIADSAGIEPGTFAAYIGTAPENRERAIAGIRKEIARIRDEHVDPEELSDAKAYLTGAFAFRFETAAQIAARLIEIHRFDLGLDYPARFAERVNAVTAGDVLRVAEKHLSPERLVEVVVGPR